MITQDRLKELLDYDPETGSFTWKVRRSIKIYPGKKAGNLQTSRRGKTPRVFIVVDGISYPAAALAWLYVTGKYPEAQMDHIDENAANNIFTNLRPVSQSQNQWNRSASCRNKSGFKGVCRTKSGTWMAQICKYGKNKYLGAYKTPEEAASVYNKAALELHGEFSNIARECPHD